MEATAWLLFNPLREPTALQHLKHFTSHYCKLMLLLIVWGNFYPMLVNPKVGRKRELHNIGLDWLAASCFGGIALFVPEGQMKKRSAPLHQH